MVGRFIAGQLRKPRGFFGRMIGNGLARSNAHEAQWTVSLLKLQPDSRVLEVGFGPGVAVQHAAELAPRGLVAGVDFSNAMVRLARKRNQSAIAAGRVDLRLGDVAALPFADAAFDAAYSIHCIYFWPQPLAGLRELRRVLKSDGLLAITILPRDKSPKERTPPVDLFTLYESSDVAHLLSSAGFRDVRMEAYPRPDEFAGECILGVK